MGSTCHDQPLYKQVGFDYVTALSELLQRFTYQEIAERVGYKSVGSVTSVLSGRTPSHIHGEAIWALYIAAFGKKPPFSSAKAQTS